MGTKFQKKKIESKKPNYEFKNKSNFKNELNNKSKNKSDYKCKIKLKNDFENKLDYESKIKLNNEFKNNPNLKFKLNIIKESDDHGCNDIFEIYISYKDNKEYLASKNVNYNIDIILLLTNNKIISLKGHNRYILTIRYFINKKNFNEYLISADYDRVVIIWDITNNYNIKHKIVINNFRVIWSCLLLFPHNIEDNYIIISNDKTGEYTKIYSLENGNFLKNIRNNEGKYYLCYLLSWYNKNDEQYYIIQLGKGVILINDLLRDRLFFKYIDGIEDQFFISGFIFNDDNKDFLCCSKSNGFIQTFDLNNKILSYSIDISCENNWLQYMIRWNQRFLIVADVYKKCFKIIDLTIKKVISKIKLSAGIRCIKKIYHPIYGESLLSVSDDGYIKLWVLFIN